MKLTWLDPNLLEELDVAEAVSILEAARLVDAPQDLSPTTSAYSAHLRHGWDGEPPEVALARDAAGTAVAVLEIHLPKRDNTHLADVGVTVDPAARRRGIGSQAFEAGVDRVKAAGRSLLCSECLVGGAGAPFLEKFGLQPASRDVWRRQELRALDRGSLEAEYSRALSSAVGYNLVRIPLPTPADLIADVVQITQAINDAPTDDLEIEDEVFSPERIRAFEAAQVAQGRRVHRLAVRHQQSGALAGHTILAIDVQRPWYAWQYDTSVLAEHRGHRLGLLLKSAMLKWMAEAEPQIRVVDTWNAASNEHMISVNEVLGYQVVTEGIRWQRHL